MSDTIKTTRGTDIRFEFNWQDADDNNVDLTGYVVRIFDEDEDAAFQPTAELIDAAEGLIRVRIPWDDNMPRRALYFRIQTERSSDDLDVSTWLLKVVYQ